MGWPALIYRGGRPPTHDGRLDLEVLAIRGSQAFQHAVNTPTSLQTLKRPQTVGQGSDSPDISRH